MTRGGMRAVLIGLAVAGACLTWLGNSLISFAGRDPTVIYGGLAAVLIGVVSLWVVFLQLRRHWRQRRDGKEAAKGSYLNQPLPFLLPPAGGQGGTLTPGDGQQLMVEVFARLQEPAVFLDAAGAVLAITPSAARQLGTITIGQRLRDGFDVEDWDYALARARHIGQPVQASLRRADGGDLLVRVNDLGPGGGIVVTLPPRARALGPLRPASPSISDLREADQPLTVLPMVSLWVVSDRGDEMVLPLVVGTVRLAGTRVFKTMATELFIDPGRPLPADAPGGEAAYFGAPDFVGSWPVISEALRGCVIVGMDVERAITDLLATAQRFGLNVPSLGPVLDLARLAGAVAPKPGSGDGDANGIAPATNDVRVLASVFGVTLSPLPPARSVFAPALWQAELAAALLPRLAAGGIITQADARAVAGVPPAASDNPLPSAIASHGISASEGDGQP